MLETPGNLEPKRTLRTKRVSGCRPFSIADAMIFIAATACSFFLLRTLSEQELWDTDPKSELGPKIASNIDMACAIASAFAMSWTIAWLIVRIRRPRPSRRYLCRQPGMVACLSASLAMLIYSAWEIGINIFHGSSSCYVGMLFWFTERIGIAVMATWFVFAVGGLMRRERGWIDRSGTLLGSFWVMRAFASFTHEFFQSL
jgi:hypothetical protein